MIIESFDKSPSLLTVMCKIYYLHYLNVEKSRVNKTELSADKSNIFFKLFVSYKPLLIIVILIAGTFVQH